MEVFIYLEHFIYRRGSILSHCYFFSIKIKERERKRNVNYHCTFCLFEQKQMGKGLELIIINAKDVNSYGSLEASSLSQGYFLCLWGYYTSKGGEAWRAVWCGLPPSPYPPRAIDKMGPWARGGATPRRISSTTLFALFPEKKIKAFFFLPRKFFISWLTILYFAERFKIKRGLK